MFLRIQSKMQSLSVIGLSILLVALLEPELYAAFKFNLPKFFDYKYFSRHYGKSNGPASDSHRNKLFLGQSLCIFKHNVLFLQRRSPYYLAQSAMADLSPDEIRKIQGQTPDLDLKPVLEAEEFGDLPANYLKSIQKLTGDIIQDGMMGPGGDQTDKFIGLEGSDEVKTSPDQVRDEYMSTENRPSEASQSSKDLQTYLDSMQENYMTPDVSDERAGLRQRSNLNSNHDLAHRISDQNQDVVLDGSMNQIMESFSNSINNLLDDSLDENSVDEVISSFSKSVEDLLQEAKEGADVSNIMNPEASSSSIKYKIDWRVTGCISPPKAQDKCNACYIFATLDLLEYFYCRQTKKRASFSGQYVLDCGREAGFINGCQGGRMSEVGRFIRNHGLRFDSGYPYIGEHGRCKSPDVDSSVIKTDIINWQLFNSITAWYTWARKSPILVGINMPSDFHIYGGGIHDGQNCNIKEAHAMLLVGSGIQDGAEFWLLKNSFSEDWGEKGYFRLSKSALLNCFGSAIVARATFSQ